MAAPSKDLKEKVRRLPHGPGVYLMKDSAQSVIYVGKAISLKNRVRSYFARSTTDRRPAARSLSSRISSSPRSRRSKASTRSRRSSAGAAVSLSVVSGRSGRARGSSAPQRAATASMRALRRGIDAGVQTTAVSSSGDRQPRVL